RHSQSVRPAITSEFLSAIEQRSWHGNIRELRNAVDHAVVLSRGGPLSASHLPPSLARTTTGAEPDQQLKSAVAHWVQHTLTDAGAESSNDIYRRFLSTAESALFDEVLVHTEQNRSAAAKLLGLDRATLRSKLGGVETNR